jgi:hypothetical protein
MQQIFEPSAKNPDFKPMNPTDQAQSWVVVVVGENP